jgi:hypothetical protein
LALGDKQQCKARGLIKKKEEEEEKGGEKEGKYI